MAPFGRLAQEANMATNVLLTGNETYTGNPPNADYIVTDNLSGTDTALSVGSNTLTLGNGIDQVTLGSGGSNTIVLGDASDTSNDTLMIGGASNTITVNGSGNNQVTTVGGINTITVGSGSNTIRLGEAVGGSPDTLTTAAGGNLVFVSAAAITGDTLNGAMTSGDGTTNRLVLTSAGTMSPAAVSGFASWQLANGGPNSLTLSEGNFVRLPGGRITITGGNSGNTINAAVLSAAHSVTIVGGAGTDVLTGGAGNDAFWFTTANLSNSDTITGGGGHNTLGIMQAGTVNAGGVSGVETIVLGNFGGTKSLTLHNANFTGTSGTITVAGGNDSNIVNASLVTNASDRVIFIGGNGTDTFTGGAGKDLFRFSAANLWNSETIKGGGRTDELSVTTAGTVHAGGVSGVETYVLADTGANVLSLTNANFANVMGGRIHVFGGAAGNTVDDSSVTGANQLVFTGGAGNDIIVAGSVTTMTGGGGANQFTFADIGTNGITDFAASASNKIVLRDSGFNLGVDEGLGTASLQHLAAGVFVANAGGTFTTTSQRFAYNTTTGALSYSASGSGSAGSAVAVLAGHPALAAGGAGQVFFTS
jgi:Ca2+-binding RTX toxin-like protein